MDIGAVRVLPLAISISEMWMAKFLSLESGECEDSLIVVERYTFPSSSQNS